MIVGFVLPEPRSLQVMPRTDALAIPVPPAGPSARAFAAPPRRRAVTVAVAASTCSARPADAVDPDAVDPDLADRLDRAAAVAHRDLGRVGPGVAPGAGAARPSIGALRPLGPGLRRPVPEVRARCEGRTA